MLTKLGTGVLQDDFHRDLWVTIPHTFAEW
jgi:hypothetical protein